MSLSWLPFGTPQGSPEADSTMTETGNILKLDLNTGDHANLEPLQNGHSNKAVHTVQSTTLTVSADDLSFDDSSSELSEARQSLNAKSLTQHQKHVSSKPIEASKLSIAVSPDTDLNEKQSEKPDSALGVTPHNEALTDSRGGVITKDQVKAAISPRISPLMKPRERTNSATSSMSSNWIQRLNTTSKATAATLSSGVSVNGDIHIHYSPILASTSADFDGDTHSVLTASPALSAIDRLTLQRTRSLDLKSESIHSSEGIEPSQAKPTPSGGGGGNDNSGGDGDDDDDDDDDDEQKSQTVGESIPAEAADRSSEAKVDPKSNDQISGDQSVQKVDGEGSGTIWSWFVKTKADSAIKPFDTTDASTNTGPEMSNVQEAKNQEPTPVDIPNTEIKNDIQATPAQPNNSPSSTITHGASYNSSSWGFFFSGASNSDKYQHDSSTQKPTTYTESGKPITENKIEDAASSPEIPQSGQGVSVPRGDNKADIQPSKSDSTSIKKKGSLTSLKSNAKSANGSQRNASASSKTEEDKSKQVVIIERSSSQDRATDTMSVAQTNEVIGGTTTCTKNVVLPSFKSQFQFTPAKEAMDNTTPNLLNKALSVINGLFANKAHKNLQGLEPLSRLKGMNEKIAHFIEDMKLEPETVAGKRFVIVGVHGWFPMKLVRSMIGEPTGTSIKFCEQMVKGVRQYFTSTHGISIPDDAMTIIPLEGEGKVEDRVQYLYDTLLENSQWLDAISSADVIFWATHSQGTPVSSILLKRLLNEGHIHMGRQQCCVLAMAGISQGPFPTLKGNLIVKYFEADAARELFEFMDSSTEISQKFRKSMASILRSGVRMVLVGSMQDQVVPLYSAVMSSASHSNLFRAIYIDGHIYNEDDFLINLIIFALRLRNAGVSDHGLLIHVSEVLAGNLYALEGGHSTIYEEVGVYTMAARYLFETAPFGKMTIAACRLPTPTKATVKSEQDIIKAGESYISPHAKHFPKEQIEEPDIESFQARLRMNPFYLPWAMRGICDDARILNDKVLNQELERLRSLFEKWNPISAKLREIKFRLEPLKARL